MNNFLAIIVTVMFMSCGVIAQAQSVKDLEQLAMDGNTEAMFNLGIKYYNGDDVNISHSKANEWWRKAAERGNFSAQLAMATAYLNGDGIKKDEAQAVYWLQLAAKWHRQAQLMLGDCYLYGIGVEKNYKLAYENYNNAKAQYNDALERLGEMYYSGYYVKEDYKKAFQFFSQVVEKKEIADFRIRADAMYMLSRCYLYGNGTKKNREKADYWYKEALNSGSRKAYDDDNDKKDLARDAGLLVSTMTQAEKDRIINDYISSMVLVKGGKFKMGATKEQGNDATKYERPVHDVKVSSFYIGATEVTQELWEAVMDTKPAYFLGGKRPVENITWEDCQKFIYILNALTGKQFRLPTEAEWEFAARGGKKSKKYKYSGSNDINKVAWFSGNSGGQTHDVATKAPNELGIYDMSGNVQEFCNDGYDGYPEKDQVDPKGGMNDKRKIVRGGCWKYDNSCRVSYRGRIDNDEWINLNGFRIVLPAK